MDYRQASSTELIDALCEQERHPDLKLVQALRNRRGGRPRSHRLPDLIDVVECEAGWPQIHAALLLCELRAEAELPTLQRAISAPEGHDLADWLADDALGKFGPAALGILEAFAADRTMAWYLRGVERIVQTVAAGQFKCILPIAVQTFYHPCRWEFVAEGDFELIVQFLAGARPRASKAEQGIYVQRGTAPFLAVCGQRFHHRGVPVVPVVHVKPWQFMSINSKY